MKTLPAAVEHGRWRTRPGRLARLLAGLALFGAGEGLLVRAALGNSPWTVLSEGVSLHTPLSIGLATIVVGALLLLLWIPLGERPGLGTVANVVVIGLALDATLLVVPQIGTGGWAGLAVRVGLLLAGVALVGFGSGLYLGTRLGPGPRDGLMTGLHRRTGQPIALVRGAVEITALGVGWLLGGTGGLGTLAFALLVGPAVQAGIAVEALRVARRARSEQASPRRQRWRCRPPAAGPPAEGRASGRRQYRKRGREVSRPTGCSSP